MGYNLEYAVTKGDAKKMMVVTLRDSTKALIDLTDWTLKLRIALNATEYIVLDATMEVFADQSSADTKGRAQYEFSAAEMNHPVGSYQMKIIRYGPDGQKIQAPLSETEIYGTYHIRASL